MHDTGSEFQSAMHEGKKDRSLLLVLHTAWRKVFFRSVCVARSQAGGGSLDCREGGPCRFNSFQKSSSLCRRRLHAMVGHPISARTDTFDCVRRLARNIALATESWSLSTRRQSTRVQRRNHRRVQRTPVPAEQDLGRDALQKRCFHSDKPIVSTCLPCSSLGELSCRRGESRIAPLSI